MKLCLTIIPSATGANSYFTVGKKTDGPLDGIAADCLSPAPNENGIEYKRIKEKNAAETIFGFIKPPEMKIAMRRTD
jgi:hypothetical protein